MNIQASKILSEFISELRYDDLPLYTIEKAKESMLDYLGALIAAYKDSSLLSDEIIELIKNNGGTEEASIIGLTKKVPLINAALANGVLSHVVELDDGHRIARGHPGVVVLSAALPLAEYLGSNGKELITAIVAGYDIFVRIASAVNPSHLNRGYHTTGTCGTLAAAAAAAKVLNLNKEQTLNALGLAGIQAAGLLEVTVSGQMAKALHTGKSAYAGVLSAILAKKGVEGPNAIIEGVKGFAKTMSDECDYDVMLDNMNKTFHIDNCYIKLYPSCRHTHSPVDAVFDMVSEYEFDYMDIAEIIIRTFPTAISFAGEIFKPKSAAEAKFSIPYCVCTALVKGKLGLRQLEMDCLNDPIILSLIDKVKIESDESLESSNPKTKGAELIVTLKDGRKMLSRINLPKGEMENPINREELIRKFISCTEHQINDKNRKQIIDSVFNLDNMRDIKEIIALLTKSNYKV